MNLTVCRSHDVRLEVVKWETDATPGVGIDPQEVISREITDYDIFLGMMWTRFGTPTGRAGSGTEEEFNNALTKYRENPDSVRIMFYFKDAPIQPSAMKGSQLSAIEEFKKSLGDKGTLYWTFADSKEFASLLRLHLTHQIQSVATGSSDLKPVQIAKVGVPIATAVEEELGLEEPDSSLGLLDFMERGLEGMNAAHKSLEKMTGFAVRLARDVQANVSELQSIGKATDLASVKKVKRSSKAVAKAMLLFANRTDKEVDSFLAEWEEAIDAFSRAMTLEGTLGSNEQKDTDEAMKNIAVFQQQVTVAQENMRALAAVSATMPPLTREIRTAQARTAVVLDKLVRTFDRASEAIAEVAKQALRTRQT